MSKRLTKDGERRRIKPTVWPHMKVQVDALREDSETPYVVLILEDGREVFLADVQAECLADQIRRALAILPTSK